MPDITGATAEDPTGPAAQTPGFGTGAATRTYTVPQGTDPVALLGARDEHLRTLERGLPRVDVLARGDEVTVSGPASDVALAMRLLEEMGGVLAGGQPLSADAVERSLRILRDSDGGVRPAQVLTANILSNRGRTIRPKTLNQKRYVDAIDANTITFGIGPAGTGKTYLAMAKAVQALQAKLVNRIVLTRPAVEAGERLGFLPGTLTDKIDPYLRPLYDALHDMVDPDSIPRLITAGTIEVAPLAYMRGRTLNDAYIILDEAQKHLTRADEDVPDPAGLRLQDGRHRRHHPGRPARRDVIGPAGRARHPGRRRRRALRLPGEHRRRPAPAHHRHRRGLRPVPGLSA